MKNMITTATPTAAVPDARAVTSEIVNLYRSGLTKQAEDYAVWAWGNHFHVTINMFAQEWANVVQAPRKNTDGIITDGIITDGIITDGMEAEAEARAHFGKDLDRWRAMACLLSTMSDHARHKRFDRLLGEAESMEDVWALYERAHKLITPHFVAYFAPGSLTPDEFVNACTREQAVGQMARMICPACVGRDFEPDHMLEPAVRDCELVASFACEDCAFPLGVKVKFI